MINIILCHNNSLKTKREEKKESKKETKTTNKTNTNKFDVEHYHSQNEHEQKILDFLRTKVGKILGFLKNLEEQDI